MRNNNGKIIFSSIIITLLLLNFSVFFLKSASLTINNSTDQKLFPKTSQINSRNVRVAIYDDDNITMPSYVSAAGLTNNHTNIQNALLAAGYEVELLTTNQIYNHELKTAKYDVFIMADHLPRENITDYVKEYWLGGGALLSMDSAICYICYEGIMPPESAGDDGNSVYWTYQVSSIQNITTRHPISKAYALNDTFTISSSQSSATFSWSALQGTSIADEVVKVATRPNLPDAATVVAFDPQSKGGKVVHLPSPREIEDDAILIDAIEWLCPTPKGRILFDLAHHPYYGIDTWDEPTDYTPRFETLRDNIVNRSYTMDKFHSGNLTLSTLELYDLLIINAPIINFTSSEVSTVANWIHNGGNLLVLGIRWSPGDFGERAENVNYLLSSFDLKINTTDSGSAVANYYNEHPTVENCAQLDFSYSAPGLITYEGNALPIWGNDANNMIIGAQEYGKGRLILSGDLFFLRETYINNQDNLQYAVNIVNWLTASDAEVLAFVHDPTFVATDPNDNIYRGPVAQALNDLDCPFYMTFTENYLNLSLTTGSYKLVIIDNSEDLIMDTVSIGLLNFLKAGGYMIISTYEYRVTAYSYLWDYIGISYGGTYMTLPQAINIWNPTHPIFSKPAPYSASTIETSLDFINTDYTMLDLHNNATAIAGLGVTPSTDDVAIVIGANGHSITNAMYLNDYYDDIDDSTYPDALEFWENEIAYMIDAMTPVAPPGGGIPGFELSIFLIVTISTIGLISLIVVMKKRK